MVKLTEDIKLLKELKKQIMENGGYCPCALVHNEDTRCMCKDFRTFVHKGLYGPCHCGLFESVELEMVQEENN